jgi:hypothetical protein
MAFGASLLWKVARLVVASGVAESAAERLIDRVKTIVTTPRTEVPPREREPRLSGRDYVDVQLARQQSKVEALEALIREQDNRISNIALTLEKFGEELRPLMLRSTITFWTSLIALVLSVVSVVLLLRQ